MNALEKAAIEEEKEEHILKAIASRYIEAEPESTNIAPEQSIKPATLPKKGSFKKIVCASKNVAANKINESRREWKSVNFANRRNRSVSNASISPVRIGLRDQTPTSISTNRRDRLRGPVCIKCSKHIGNDGIYASINGQPVHYGCFVYKVIL